jgi:hypothetical protein
MSAPTSTAPKPSKPSVSIRRRGLSGLAAHGLNDGGDGDGLDS